MLTVGYVEWIKGLLAVPFVLYSQPTGAFDGKGFSQAKAQEEAQRRYSEILRDVEFMIDDYSKCAAVMDVATCGWDSRLTSTVPAPE